MSSVTVATVATPRLDVSTLSQVLASAPEPDFIVNLESGAFLTNKAWKLAVRNHVPVGRMGDLDRALSLHEDREYVDSETKFRERGLEQHSHGRSFERLGSDLYRVERYGLPRLMVVFLNDYDLGADAIREARKKYGAFNIVVASNPNGRITDAAFDVASELESEVHQWGAFLSRLRREHQ
jgi:hypothetical protein